MTRTSKPDRARTLATARLAAATGDHDLARELFASQGFVYIPAHQITY